MKTEQMAVSSYLDSNLRYLRKSQGWTQDDLSQLLQVKRSRIAAWEEGRAEPPLPLFFKLCMIFQVSGYSLYNQDLSDPSTTVLSPEIVPYYTWSQLQQAISPVLGNSQAASLIFKNLGIAL